MVPLTPLIPNKIARVIVVCMAAPMFFGYLVGSQTKENMNIIRYWQVKFKTFMEPKELFRFEEVEQAKKSHISARFLFTENDVRSGDGNGYPK